MGIMVFNATSCHWGECCFPDDRYEKTYITYITYLGIALIFHQQILFDMEGSST